MVGVQSFGGAGTGKRLAGHARVLLHATPIHDPSHGYVRISRYASAWQITSGATSCSDKTLTSTLHPKSIGAVADDCSKSAWKMASTLAAHCAWYATAYHASRRAGTGLVSLLMRRVEQVLGNHNHWCCKHDTEYSCEQKVNFYTPQLQYRELQRGETNACMLSFVSKPGHRLPLVSWRAALI